MYINNQSKKIAPYPDGVGQETEGNPVIQLHHILEEDKNFEVA